MHSVDDRDVDHRGDHAADQQGTEDGLEARLDLLETAIERLSKI